MFAPAALIDVGEIKRGDFNVYDRCKNKKYSILYL